VYQLVKGTLQKSRVYRHDGSEALRRQPGSKGNRVLLADADIKNAVGKLVLDNSLPASPG